MYILTISYRYEVDLIFTIQEVLEAINAKGKVNAKQSDFKNAFWSKWDKPMISAKCYIPFNIQYLKFLHGLYPFYFRRKCVEVNVQLAVVSCLLLLTVC